MIRHVSALIRIFTHGITQQGKVLTPFADAVYGLVRSMAYFASPCSAVRRDGFPDRSKYCIELFYMIVINHILLYITVFILTMLSLIIYYLFYTHLSFII